MRFVRLVRMNTLSRLIILFFCCIASASAQEQFADLSIKGIAIRAEIANTPQQRERGLMERAKLCDNCGMLFVFEKPARYAFWMKNTPIPLSIAFISADGVVVNVDEMQAETETAHYAGGDVLYALEMGTGWFAAHSVKSGDRIEGLNLPRQ
jgi:uncharacterized membrane protein (UPF0127 family)